MKITGICPKCGRPFVRGTMMCPFCRSKKEVYKKLWGLTKGLRLMLLFPLIVAAFSVAFQFIVPAIQRAAVNDFITNEAIRPVLPGSPAMRGFIGIIAAIVSIDLFQRLLNVIQGRLNVISGNRFTLMMRALLYEKIQNLSLSSISNKSTGDLMGRITGDVSTVQGFMTGQLPSLFVQVVSFILAVFLLFYMNPLMSLFVFVPIPLVVFLIYKFWETVQLRNRKAWMLNRRVNQLLQDTLNGIRVVKTFGSEEREIKKFADCSHRLAQISASNEKTWGLVFPPLEFFVGIGEFFVLYIGGRMVLADEMTLGELVQFVLFLSYIYQPMRWLSSLPRWLARAMTSMVKIFEILDEKPEITDPGVPENRPISGGIEFKNVRFGYKAYEPVLKNVNVKINPGEMIGLVGPSGSGKTTMINLLMRLYDPNAGAILVDGVDIRDIAQRDLHDNMGVVFQETFLFAGSVYENITYAREDATYEEVVAAAKAANAHEFIMKLPDGYNTVIGENGHNLSGGERQRLSIARAVLKNPRILILDEATSSLDPKTENQIQEALGRLIENRTTIAIAHRLATLRHADRLVVIDKGRIAEVGSHKELLEKKGIYYRLVMAQRQTAKLKN